jgi:hypothetical protein
MSFTMLCDVISAVTEFMVRVLHSRSVDEQAFRLFCAPAVVCVLAIEAFKRV